MPPSSNLRRTRWFCNRALSPVPVEHKVVSLPVTDAELIPEVIGTNPINEAEVDDAEIDDEVCCYIVLRLNKNFLSQYDLDGGALFTR